LWIGVDRFNLEMVDKVYEVLMEKYEGLLNYGKSNKDFFESFSPIEIKEFLEDIPDIAIRMLEASNLAGVGPVASVAGTFAEVVGKYLIEKWDCEEVIVENGWDIYLNVHSDIRVGFFANFESEFNRLALLIPPGEYGVCTSSGKIGHSISFGRADATCVIAKQASIADAFATKYGNMLKSERHIDKIIDFVKEDVDKKQNILGAIFIYGKRLLVYGNVKLSFSSKRIMNWRR